MTNIGLPSTLHSTLSYDANNAYLNLVLNFATPGGSLNTNQQAVGNALTNFFNSTGGIPAVFAALSPAALSQASGETATGSAADHVQCDESVPRHHDRSIPRPDAAARPLPDRPRQRSRTKTPARSVTQPAVRAAAVPNATPTA